MKIESSEFFSKFQIDWPPWFYFVLFLFSNGLLSYVPLSLTLKLWVGFLGVLLPFLIWIWSCLEKRLHPPEGQKTFPPTFGESFPDFPIPSWIWILFLFILLLTRLYHLTSLPIWPLSDEGTFSFLATDLSHHWHRDLLWTAGRIEPLLIWSLASFFHLSEPSLFSLRLYCALLSLGSVGLAYWTLRQYFPKYYSFLFTWLFAFSFWEYSLMRFCTPEDLIPLFQFLSLGLLGGFLKSPNGNASWVWIGGLGLCNILGFYSYTNWAVVWLFITMVLLARWAGSKEGGMKYFIFFQGLTLIPLIPLVLARLAPGGAAYILLCWNQLFSLQSILSYGVGLLWDSKISFPFAPNWGGMLDPITGSLLLLGLGLSLKKMNLTWLALGAGGLTASLLPGIVTNHLELHRITPALPFLVGLAALGLQELSKIQWKFNSLTTALLLGLPLGLNTYNYVGPYNNPHLVSSDRQWRNMAYYDAYQKLSSLAQKEGPLYLFTEFNTDYDNKTLDLACYPFDAVQNPSLRKTSPRWTVLICNLQYAPYFIQNFPGLKIQLLSTDKREPEDPKPFGIFWIPTSQVHPARLEDWKTASEIFREVDFEVKNKSSIVTWEGPLESLPQLSTQFQQDPFLTAIYWEKVGFFKFLDVHILEATQAYENAIRLGIPAAHLYYDLGVCLKLQSRTAESQKCFEKAAALSKFMN